MNKNILILALTSALASCDGSNDSGGDDVAPWRCDEELVDLDGDGALTTSDCALATEGAATARRCAADDLLWRVTDDCATEDRLTFTGVLGSMEAWSVAGSAFVILTPDAITVLVPPKQISQSNGEATTWSQSTVPGYWGSRIVGSSPAISSVFGLTDLVVVATDSTIWIDANRNLAVEEPELRDIRDLFGIAPMTPIYTIVATASLDPVVVVGVGVGTGGDTIAWRDLNRDGSTDPAELIRLVETYPVGAGDGWLAYRNRTEPAPIAWRSSDWTVNPSELAPLWVDYRCSRVLSVWSSRPVCQNSDNAIIDYSLAVAPEDAPLVHLPGLRVTNVSHDFQLRVQFHNSDVVDKKWSWIDANFDYVAQGSELTNMGERRVWAGAVEFREGWSWGPSALIVDEDVVGVTVEQLDPNNTGGPTETVARRRRPALRFLGDKCAEGPCAQNLQCRVPIAASEPHCALPSE